VRDVSGHREVTTILAEKLETQSFAAYGRIIESNREGFSAVFAPSEGGPWLVGINNVIDTAVASLHYHPDTWECFAPLSGDLFIAVAQAEWNPNEQGASADDVVRVFHITSPVCVAPYTWHTLISPVSCAAFICENAAVTGHRVSLEPPLAVRFA
jgi:ureidoglycolate hydrolase